MKIQSIRAIEILDSRGNPTILTEVMTETGLVGKASVPSGASTSDKEALELRDKDKYRYLGKGVLKAVSHVNEELNALLKGKDLYDQVGIDHKMIEADGTEEKKKFGANAILSISLACARTAALSLNTPLYRYIGGFNATRLPCPMMNVINGGMHADNGLEFQEFMIRPIGALTFSEALRWGVEIFHTLKDLLHKEGHVTSVGDEGGFAPRLTSHEAALDFLLQAIEHAGLKPKKQISIALDCAASTFYDASLKTYLEKKKRDAKQPFVERTTDEEIDYLAQLVHDYPIDSIEDGLDENDWDGWTKLTERLGSTIQIVGDDLFATHLKYLKKGVEARAANAILIKPNQVGTLTETLQAVNYAKEHNFKIILSHRSGETEDSILADIAVGCGAHQIKTGSLCRSERIAKYNRLLEIEAELGPRAVFST